MNKTRKFDGKVYTYQETSIKSKADADKYANKLRSQGHKVRKVKKEKTWAFYIR